MTILLNTQINTHPQSQTNCKVAMVTAAMKQYATETLMKFQQILAQQLAGISECVAQVENLHPSILSAHRERDLPPLPINIAAIPILPIKFQTTTSGGQFSYFTLVQVSLIESLHSHQSVQAKQLFIESENWYTVDTFKVCFKVFYQLHIFLVQQGG